MKCLLTYIMVMIALAPVRAQVTGNVTDGTNKAIPFATVTLLNNLDSSLVKAALTNANGRYKFPPVTKGKYIIRVSSINYENYTSAVFEITDGLSGRDMGTITLQETLKQLNEVVIKADKPLVQQQTGGMTVNVQNSIMTKGSSVLQVLERSPGVNINRRNNSITLNGKSGVMVMQDGKLMRMSPTQVLALLNGMSADDIDKIELLNTPPAKYDADGNAGLINIITRKNKKRGTNGSTTATAGYGKGEKASAAISINHNTAQVGLHGSYSYAHERNYGELFAGGTENVAAIGGQTSFNYNGIGKPVSDYQHAITGIDINVNPKTTIGASVDYTYGTDHSSNHNHGNYKLASDTDQLFNSYLDGTSHSKNLVNSIYIDKELGKAQKIMFAVDYIYYATNGQTDVQSTFVDNYGNPVGQGDNLYAPQQRDMMNTTIKVSVGKVDYSKLLTSKLKLESGLKGTYTRSYSTSGIENLVDGEYVLSSVGVSNNLGTKEIIAAAYSTLNIQLDTLTNLTFGARYEYAHNTTDHASNSLYAIDRKLGKLFPSIFFTHKLNDNDALQASYTKRISRPSFSDLASYVTYNDPVSVFTGNPALKPTITDNIRLAYNFGNYLFSLLFSRDKNVILQTQISTGPSEGLVYLAPQNAPWQNNISFQTSIPIKIQQWWNSTYSFVGGVTKYRIDYTPQAFEKNYFGYSINFTETFKPAPSLAIELSGYYNSPSYYGTSRTNGNGILNLGIRKDLNHNRGGFQLSIADITCAGSYSSYIGGLTTDAFNSQVHVRYNVESRKFPVFRLTYNRSFGSSANKSQRKENNASRDERNRL